MKLLGSIAIIKNAWGVYIGHFRAFAEPLIWMLIPGVILATLPVIPNLSNTLLGFSIVAAIAGYILIYIWAFVRITDVSHAIYEGRLPPESLTRSLSWGSLGRLIDLCLLGTLLFAVIVSGFLLFVIPALVFSFWFMFTFYCFLIEGASPGTAALRRSKELVSGRFWSIVWRVLVLDLILSGAIIAGAFLIPQLIGLALNIPFNSNLAALPWWVGLISGFCVTVITSFSYVVGLIFFLEAKKSHRT